MEDMGLQKSYSSKEDEDEALKALAMRLDVPYRPDSFADWIGDWMEDLQSPAMYDVEDDLMVSYRETDAKWIEIMGSDFPKVSQWKYSEKMFFVFMMQWESMHEFYQKCWFSVDCDRKYKWSTFSNWIHNTLYTKISIICKFF